MTTTKKKIAAVITEYRPRSHADVIVSKFLKGFPTDEGLCAPRVEIASMYIDQFPKTTWDGQWPKSTGCRFLTASQRRFV